MVYAKRSILLSKFSYKDELDAECLPFHYERDDVSERTANFEGGRPAK